MTRPFASLRAKIVMLLLAAVILPLAAVGVGLDAYLAHLSREQAHERGRQALTTFSEAVSSNETWLRTTADGLRSNESTVAALNLIARYQDMQDYRPIVFDEAKKDLGLDLLDVITRGRADHALVHQGDGQLVAYAVQGAAGPVTGIVSFEQGRPRYLEREGAGNWRRVTRPSLSEGSRQPARAADVAYRRGPERVEQLVSRPVFRHRDGGQGLRLGTITLLKDLGTPFLQAFTLPEGVALALFAPQGHLIAGPASLASIPEDITGELFPPSNTGSGGHWLTLPDALLTTRPMPGLTGDPEILLGIAFQRSLLEPDMAAARRVVLVALGSSALLFIPLGLLFIHGRIQRPIDGLIAGVTALREGHYDSRVEVGDDREPRQLAAAMNEMAAAVQRRETELRDIIENIPEMIFVKDAETLRFVRFNRAGEQLLGLNREDLVGRRDSELFPAAQAQRFTAGDREVLAEGRLVESEEEPIGTPHGQRLLHTRKLPILAPSGKPRYVLGIAEDVTERRRDEARLREAQRVARMGDWELNLRTRQATWSEQARRILDVGEHESAGPETLREHCHPDDWPRLEQALEEVLRGEGDYDVEYRIVTGAGSERTVHSRARLERDGNGQPLRLVGVVQDISERVRAEEQQRLANAVFENTTEAVIVTDAQDRILRVNPAFSEITGYPADEVLGETSRLLRSGRHDEGFYAGIRSTLDTEGHWQGEIWNRRRDGTVFPAWQTISTVHNEAGRVSQYISLISDITSLKAVEERLDYMAHHDALTGLPNRHLLHDRLGQAIARARREEQLVGVLFLDLDRFKNINDSFGHPLGDRLLQAVAQRLVPLLREADTLARIGGDEYVVIMEGAAAEAEMATLADRLVKAFERPFRVEGHELSVDASIGISIFPLDGREASILLRNADTAMYRAKESRRNSYVFYTAELTERASRRVRLEMQLRRALERGELALHYQPQVRLSSDRVVGLEALLRWTNPRLGEVPPGDFIPLAEETRAILAIGEWVLGRACCDFQALLDAGHDLKRIAVNVSAVQVQQGDLLATVDTALQQSGLAAERLELELTEAVFMEEPEAAVETLRRLHERGVQLAVDDFGTGFSSLAYLKQFPVTRLKIDQSFVRDMLTDNDDHAIVRSVIALGASLDLAVIAEGVETRAQAEALLADGCGEAQGFYYSGPRPYDQLIPQLTHPASKRLRAKGG
ncbi:sensor domain-containing protein [Arhodomonas sp. SL1]|uniref:sensor domain-containing protein n=1 Tax=Arhodomonas sp. SL1 TaxID=3425691 RepID=UPI003F881196